mmetsp:Transcript_11419/g.40392  ORF Transcript_11419/g.40392 Transcript_11419/m.40392 type:complete len:217 (-) Transcript_11419:89-739(-)
MRRRRRRASLAGDTGGIDCLLSTRRRRGPLRSALRGGQGAPRAVAAARLPHLRRGLPRRRRGLPLLRRPRATSGADARRRRVTRPPPASTDRASKTPFSVKGGRQVILLSLAGFFNARATLAAPSRADAPVPEGAERTHPQVGLPFPRPFQTALSGDFSATCPNGDFSREEARQTDAAELDHRLRGDLEHLEPYWRHGDERTASEMLSRGTPPATP